MTITPAPSKNGFFTYVTIEGLAKTTREFSQEFNHKGLLLQFQGNMAGHGSSLSYNGFGKRHLVYSTGSGKSATDKMASTATKRLTKASTQSEKEYNLQSGSMRRNKKFDQLVQAEKKATGGKLTVIKDEVKRNVYSPDAYGAKTNTCTFVLLDGLDKAAVLDAFADAINTFQSTVKAIADDTYELVTIMFGDGRVHTYIGAAPSATADGIQVRVMKSSKVKPNCYHIYHLEKAV